MGSWGGQRSITESGLELEGQQQVTQMTLMLKRKGQDDRPVNTKSDTQGIGKGEQKVGSQART